MELITKACEVTLKSIFMSRFIHMYNIVLYNVYVVLLDRSFFKKTSSTQKGFNTNIATIIIIISSSITLHDF